MTGVPGVAAVTGAPELIHSPEVWAGVVHRPGKSMTGSGSFRPVLGVPQLGGSQPKGNPMSDTPLAAVEPPSSSERGMATVEYALGVVVVIVLIGVIVAAIQTGTFNELVQQLLEAIMGWVTDAFDVPLPGFFSGKP